MCTRHAVALMSVPNTHSMRNSLSIEVLRIHFRWPRADARQIHHRTMGVLPHPIGEMPHVVGDGRHKLFNLNIVESLKCKPSAKFHCRRCDLCHVDLCDSLLYYCVATIDVNAGPLQRTHARFGDSRACNSFFKETDCCRQGVQVMNHALTTAMPPVPNLPARQVYFMAAFCLCAGLGIGYLLRIPTSALPLQQRPAQTAAASQKPAGRHPSLEEMRLMADKKAAPLLERLQANPNDTSLLVQIAAIYHTTHQFKEAANYYNRALTSDPKDVAIRTKLASSLYRSGDIDGAVAQLNLALEVQPTDANALFDLGMIRLQGKGDAKGAVTTWQRLLKTNPQLSPVQKATVLKMMADAMTMMGDQQGIKKAQNSNGQQ
jgi:cytochrome c-type biogenesis protein CcmH/NrfG